jgi:hypothetical protein
VHGFVASGDARRKSVGKLSRGRSVEEDCVNDKVLREHLASLLSGGNAHVDAKATFAGIPAKLKGVRPEGLPFSIWELLEHMRIAQWDILEFSRDAKHVSPEWPKGYWPKAKQNPTPAMWEKSLKAFTRDLTAMKKLVGNAKTDLFAPIPHGKGQTILREALLVADHNAYHLGQILLVRRLLGNWK